MMTGVADTVRTVSVFDCQGDTAMPYETIEVKPATAAIGAEIFGADLSKPLGNQQFQEVHDALMAHQTKR